MKMSILRATTLGLLVATALVGSATAADLPATASAPVVGSPGDPFSVWLGPSYFSAPVANGLGTVNDQGNFTFISQSDNGASLSGVGVSGGVSAWIPTDGMDLFAIVDGDFASSITNSSVLSSTTFLDTLPINGNPSGGAIATGGGSNSAATVNYGRLEGAFGVGMEPASNVHVGLGILGSVGELDLHSTVSSASNAAENEQLSEQVSFYSAGPVARAELTTDVSNGVSATLGAQGAVLYAHGALSGTQTASSHFTNPGTVTSSEDALAFAGKLKAGLNFAVGNDLTLSLSGDAGARNDYFSIVNPRSAPGLVANNPGSYNPGPAHLQQDWMWDAGISAGLNGKF